MCLCLSIYSALHTAPLSSEWQAIPSGAGWALPVQRPAFRALHPVIGRAGRVGEGEDIQGSQCSVHNFFSQYSFCSLPAPLQFCCLLLVLVDRVFKKQGKTTQIVFLL